MQIRKAKHLLSGTANGLQVGKVCAVLVVFGLVACGERTSGFAADSADAIIAELKKKGGQIANEKDWEEYRNTLADFLVSADSIVNTPAYLTRVRELEQLAERYDEPDWQTLLPKKTVFVEDKKVEFSYTIHKGDSTRWYVDVDGVADRIKLIEERTGRILESNTRSALFEFEHHADYTDVYTLIVECSTPRYAEVQIDRRPRDAKSYFQSTEYVVDTLPSHSGDKKAIKYEELIMTNVFPEPYKLVVSRQMTLSGAPRITIPIELPKGTQEFIYQVRISGEERESSEDGQLYDKLNSKYKEYKLFGVKVFESTSTGSSLTRELLNAIGVPKREKFSCNIYFFDAENDARNFVESSPKGFKYDMKNSIKNSESRNGVIKYKNQGFVYLGLESTSTFNTTYAWVDVVAAKLETRYARISKKPVESESY